MSDAPLIYFTGNKPSATLLPTVKALLTTPGSFFENMPRAIYFKDAMFFISIVVFAFSFLSIPFHGALFLFMLPVTWGAVLISLWLWSKYMSWAVRTFTDKKLSAANAFQLSGYASLPMLLCAIPYVGAVAGLWNLYLIWLGLVSYCRVSAGAAMVILIVPIVVLGATTAVFTTMLIKAVPQLAG
ncbi:MAG TPA: YIP1 family protein [Mariprofundaceae bacterium]|nr:YIP1 family protein [Mariprofundaceae bacterium]